MTPILWVFERVVGLMIIAVFWDNRRARQRYWNNI